MFRPQPSMVMKYVDQLDSFVRFRIFSKEDIAQLLSQIEIADRRSYVSTVLETCVARMPESVHEKELDDSHVGDCLREILYDVCVGLNPGLDIHKVILPVSDLAIDEEELSVSTAERKAVESQKRMDARVLATELKKRIVGQDEAVQAVANAVARAHAGLRDPERPVGTYLFAGQTGVGKTELAKALADILSDGDHKDFVRVDCSEYSLPHEYAKLIGAPPGYVGHEQGGYLSSVMSQANARVVLFDEIEKADEKVHNLLLQIMDEGFVTDAKGVRIDFTNSLIIFTSNLGASEADQLQHRCGFSNANAKPLARNARLQATMEALRKKFKPEFLNRIDETIMFNQLDANDAGCILDKFTDLLAERARKQGIELALSSEVRSWLLEKGFSAAHGAREMRRCVQRHLEVPLADELLTDRHVQGGVLTAHFKKEKLVFKKSKKKAPGKASKAKRQMAKTP